MPRLTRRATALVLSSVLLAVSAPAPRAQTPGAAEHRVPSSDGFLLSARHHSPGRPGPGVLLLHQCDRKGAPTGWEALTRALVERGLHVVVLDLRGYGASVSDAFGPDDWEKARAFFGDDVEAAYQFLVSRPGVSKESVAVGGASCGGGQAMALARRHASVAALVLVSSTFPAGFESGFAPLADRPLLIATSAGDPFGRSHEGSKSAFELSRHPASRLLVYKGTDHGTPLFDRDGALAGAVAAWLAAQLAR